MTNQNKTKNDFKKFNRIVCRLPVPISGNSDMEEPEVLNEWITVADYLFLNKSIESAKDFLTLPTDEINHRLFINDMFIRSERLPYYHKHKQAQEQYREYFTHYELPVVEIENPFIHKPDFIDIILEDYATPDYLSISSFADYFLKRCFSLQHPIPSKYFAGNMYVKDKTLNRHEIIKCFKNFRKCFEKFELKTNVDLNKNYRALLKNNATLKTDLPEPPKQEYLYRRTKTEAIFETYMELTAWPDLVIEPMNLNTNVHLRLKRKPGENWSVSGLWFREIELGC